MGVLCAEPSFAPEYVSLSSCVDGEEVVEELPAPGATPGTMAAVYVVWMPTEHMPARAQARSATVHSQLLYPEIATALPCGKAAARWAATRLTMAPRCP